MRKSPTRRRRRRNHARTRERDRAARVAGNEVTAWKSVAKWLVTVGVPVVLTVVLTVWAIVSQETSAVRGDYRTELLQTQTDTRSALERMARSVDSLNRRLDELGRKQVRR